MSVGLSFSVKLVAMGVGVAASLAAWNAVSGDLLGSDGEGISLASIAPQQRSAPVQPATVQPNNTVQADINVPKLDVPAYDSALFGMQEAVQSVGDVFRQAITLDFGGGGGSSFQSSEREMVRSVGGAKFVSMR